MILQVTMENGGDVFFRQTVYMIFACFIFSPHLVANKCSFYITTVTIHFYNKDTFLELTDLAKATVRYI